MFHKDGEYFWINLKHVDDKCLKWIGLMVSGECPHAGTADRNAPSGAVIGGLLKDVGLNLKIPLCHYHPLPVRYQSCMSAVYLAVGGDKAEDNEKPPEAKEAVDADMDMFG